MVKKYSNNVQPVLGRYKYLTHIVAYIYIYLEGHDEVVRKGRLGYRLDLRHSSTRLAPLNIFSNRPGEENRFLNHEQGNT